jgi:TonB family protein
MQSPQCFSEIIGRMPTVFASLLTLLLLWQTQLPTLRFAISPAAPLNTVFAGVVVLVAQAGANGDVQNLSALVGPQPFLDASVAAVRKWKWTSVTGETNSPVSVTFFYRARQILTSAPPTQFPDWGALQTRPPLPETIFDSGYPVNSVGEGVVILELRVSPQGVVENVRVVQGVPSLTELAESTVQRWRFTPARNGGDPATGIAIVAISFLRPITH